MLEKWLHARVRVLLTMNHSIAAQENLVHQSLANPLSIPQHSREHVQLLTAMLMMMQQVLSLALEPTTSSPFVQKAHEKDFSTIKSSIINRASQSRA